MHEIYGSRKPVVLVVDDQPVNLELLAGLLSREFRVEKACSGEEALELGSHITPDLVLMDIGMDGMDGIEACRKLKQRENMSSVPVIFVTGMLDDGKEDECFDAGAVDFLLKPVSERSLLNRVRAHLALKFQADVLRNLAFYDHLTGLGNRKFLMDQLNRHIKLTRRDSSSLVVALMDLDYFKRYNDTYGHVKGDDCLRGVAHAIEDALKRPLDVAARFGGEEFVLVLPDTDETGAKAVLERVQENILALAMPHAESPHGQVSMSIGAFVLRGGEEERKPEYLLKEADKALYSVKGGGRNGFLVTDNSGQALVCRFLRR